MRNLLFFCIANIIVFSQCSSPREKREEVVVQEEQTDGVIPEGEAISFYLYEEKNDFPDAVIEMYTPLGNQKFRPGKVPFEFNIKNYPFDAGLSGFQLKMVLNGSDPVGYNSPIFQRELNEGTYRAVAYLVDEEGLALKEFGNYVDRDFMVGDTRPFPYSAEPYIAINKPVNNQRFAKGEEVTLDWMLIGGDIALDNLTVTIALNEHTYKVSEVTPVRIANLPAGEYSVIVKLINKRTDKELDGPFSSVRKTIVVE